MMDFETYLMAILDSNLPEIKDEVKEIISKNILLYKGEEERPQGEWIIDKENSFTIDMFKCSICGYFGHTHFKFCPDCGADMRGNTKRKGTPIEGNNESYNCENWIP